MAQDINSGTTAVYLPFRTFLTALDILGQGRPPRVDKSVFASFSGVTQALVIATFKTLGLIDDAGNPQATLLALIEGGADRERLVGQLVRNTYPEIVELGTRNASPAQLDEAMRKRGVQGSTLRKAITFYLQAAEFTSLPVSSLWPKAKRRPAGRGQRRNGGITRRRRLPPKGQTPPANADRASAGTTRTVTLPSGGTAALTLSVDVFDLSEGERVGVFDLIDRLMRLPDSAGHDRTTPAETGSDEP